jgi:hypothetical protein
MADFARFGWPTRLKAVADTASNTTAPAADATSALLIELAQLGRVHLSGGDGRVIRGSPDQWSAGIEIPTPGNGELNFYAHRRPSPLRALHDLKEQVDIYMNHGRGQ